MKTITIKKNSSTIIELSTDIYKGHRFFKMMEKDIDSTGIAYNTKKNLTLNGYTFPEFFEALKTNYDDIVDFFYLKN